MQNQNSLFKNNKRFIAKEIIAFVSAIVFMLILFVLIIVNNVISTNIKSNKALLREKELNYADSLERPMNNKLLIDATATEKMNYYQGEALYKKWRTLDKKESLFEKLYVEDVTTFLIYAGVFLIIIVYPIRYLIMIFTWAVKTLKNTQ